MWKLYQDAACTQPFPGLLKTLQHKANLSDNPQDFSVYLAEVEDDPLDAGSLMLLDQAAPDVDPVTLYIDDTAPGAGHEATEVTLALSASALGTNTPGDPLGVAVRLYSGASNAVEIHIRVVNAVTDVSRSDELQIWLDQTTVLTAA